MKIPVLSDRADVRPFRVSFSSPSWHKLWAAPQRLSDLVAVATVAGLKTRNGVKYGEGVASVEILATAEQIRRLEQSCP